MKPAAALESKIQGQQVSGRFLLPGMLICLSEIKEAGLKEASLTGTDYQKMEKAIRFLEEHSEGQPTLEEAARYVNLSPYHFQRLFKKWVGVSPKRYLQFLTVENAKRLLHQSASVMDTAFDVGLSGPGRLHDLFVSVETVTPGQFKSRGQYVEIRYSVSDSPFGRCVLAMTKKGVCDLRFVDRAHEDHSIRDLSKKWSAAVLSEDQQMGDEMVSRIFSHMSGPGPEKLSLDLYGTNFQIKVWQALLRIPEGAVVSYTDVARRVGRPDAVRAVAGAVGKNPVAWLIPCHRVLRNSGELGGYRWGLTRKKIMLARELKNNSRIGVSV
jgi:AraC family transcriptional regulator of adaptative response/methylated-DNA-[protein]-cysteine methyltransferase